MATTSIERAKVLERQKWEGHGITIRPVGIGDGIQFTSLFENYFFKSNVKLIDVSKPWYLDFNPYADRDSIPTQFTELWNYPRIAEWNPPRTSVYLTNAEIHCTFIGIQNPHLIRPKLYRYENYPFEKRELILFHPYGKSHGALPDHVIDHVIKKYKHTKALYQIGLDTDPTVGIPRLSTPDMWNLCEVISQARMFIGIDSGPSWIAACYPDVEVKKIRARFQFGFCEPKDWIPLDIRNEHSFWDDCQLFKIYNCFDQDVGFTMSYKKI